MFPHSTIEHFRPKLGYVTLRGKVDPTADYAIETLAVMPFVWRFAPVHGTDEDHGWRRASKHDHFGLDANGEWMVTDVRPGVQYAVIVVEGEYFEQPSPPDRVFELVGELMHDPGTLPRGGLGLPEFTHRQYDIHIGSAPEDHLTGAVLGVGRATWNEPGPDVDEDVPFQVAAWATNPSGTFFIGMKDCEPSGYWSFGDILSPLRTAHNFTVALVNAGFRPPDQGAPSPVPVLGPNILGLDSRPHEPLRTHGSGNSSRR